MDGQMNTISYLMHTLKATGSEFFHQHWEILNYKLKKPKQTNKQPALSYVYCEQEEKRWWAITVICFINTAQESLT